jgi:hypothetical protein
VFFDGVTSVYLGSRFFLTSCYGLCFTHFYFSFSFLLWHGALVGHYGCMYRGDLLVYTLGDGECILFSEAVLF